MAYVKTNRQIATRSRVCAEITPVLKSLARYCPLEFRCHRYYSGAALRSSRKVFEAL